MTHVGRWRTYGPFAGVPVVLKETPGEHLWFIKFHAYVGDERIEHELRHDKPVRISALTDVCTKEMKEVYGETLPKKAGWDVYLRGTTKYKRK